MIPIRQSTAFEVAVGPVLDADGVAVTDCVVGDFKLKKTTGNFAALNGSATLTHVSAGVYDLVGTTSDSDTVGIATIAIDDTVNACQMVYLQVLEEAVYDAQYAASAPGYVANAPVNVAQWLGVAPLALTSRGLLKTEAFITELTVSSVASGQLNPICSGGITTSDNTYDYAITIITDVTNGETCLRDVLQWDGSTGQIVLNLSTPFTLAIGDKIVLYANSYNNSFSMPQNHAPGTADGLLIAGANAATTMSSLILTNGLVGNILGSIAELGGFTLGKGTVGGTGNDATHVHINGVASYGNDEIVDYTLVVYDTSASEYHARYIDDYADTGDLATVETLPFTPVNTDLWWLFPIKRVSAPTVEEIRAELEETGSLLYEAHNILDNLEDIEDARVTLAASQPDYAPAVAGDEMDLVDAPNSTARTAIATTVAANASIAATNTTVGRLDRATKTIVEGTVGSGSSETSIVTSAIDPDAGAADCFKGLVLKFAKDTTTAALRGQGTDITANTSGATPTLTVTALTTAPASGDVFVIE